MCLLSPGHKPVVRRQPSMHCSWVCVCTRACTFSASALRVSHTQFDGGSSTGQHIITTACTDTDTTSTAISCARFVHRISHHRQRQPPNQSASCWSNTTSQRSTLNLSVYFFSFFFCESFSLSLFRRFSSRQKIIPSFVINIMIIIVDGAQRTARNEPNAMAKTLNIFRLVYGVYYVASRVGIAVVN